MSYPVPPTAAAPPTAETVPEDLAALLAEIAGCRICRDRPLGLPLPHEPRPVLRPSATARLLIAGQAPGTRVHASGLPFTDPSGDRLRSWLGLSPEAFYDRERVAIVPMGFCFPGQDAKGGDLPPRRECAPAWRARLLAQMPRVELVLAVGTYAQSWHRTAVLAGAAAPRRNAASAVTAKATSMAEVVAGWRSALADERRPAVLALPHPSWRNTAWLKRNPWFEAELVPVLREKVAALVPTRGDLGV